MPGHLKKVSEEVVHSNDWWEYKHDVFEKPDGTMGDYWYGEERGGVMIVPVLDDGRIVLVRQHRYLFDRWSIEFACGGIEKDESMQDAAIRELKEETGCVGEDWVSIGAFESTNGFFKEPMNVFKVYVSEQGEQELDDVEQIEVLIRRPDEIEDMVRRGEIWDGQTLATWAMVRHYFV